MTGKEYLSRYQSCERRIKAKEEKMLELKSMAVSISISLKERVQTSRQVNKTEKIISMYLDMEKAIAKDVAELRKFLKEISNTINKLDDLDQKELLELRYINGHGFPKISENMCICERQVYRIHGKALENIETILEKK